MLLKALPVTIRGPRPIDEAIITKGGVALAEISPKTMESKLVKGLYFAGEVLDLDAYTGGFNLQIAFSTAVLAGESAALTSEE
jgi:predicted flavoprotein YhiN